MFPMLHAENVGVAWGGGYSFCIVNGIIIIILPRSAFFVMEFKV